MDDVLTIAGRRFALGVRGYDQDEVDEFLRVLATRLNDGSDPAAEAARIAGVTRFTVVTLGYARNEVHQYLNDLRLLLMRRAGASIVSDVSDPVVEVESAASADEVGGPSPAQFAPSATYPWLMAPAEELPVVEESVAEHNHKAEAEIETEPAPAAEPEAQAADPVSEEVMAALRRARDALNAFEARLKAGALRETVEAAGQTAASMPAAGAASEALAPSHAGSHAPAAGETEDRPDVAGLTRDIIKLLQGRPVPDKDRR